MPAELDGRALRDRYVKTMDRPFETYARWIPADAGVLERRYPEGAGGFATRVHRMTIRAKALDTLRGMLPGRDAVERRHLRDRPGVRGAPAPHAGPPAREVRDYADQMLVELRKVIPAFLDAGSIGRSAVALGEYWPQRERGIDASPPPARASSPSRGDEVTLTDFDPDGEVKVVAAALYAVSELPDDQLLEIARKLSADERVAVLRAYVGNRDEPPPPAGPGIRAHDLSIRRADRLRRLSRPAASSAADARMATAVAAARLHEPDAIAEAGARDDWTARDGRRPPTSTTRSRPRA